MTDQMIEAEDGWTAYFAKDGRVEPREVKFWIHQAASGGPLRCMCHSESLPEIRPVVKGPKGLAPVGPGSGYLGSIQGDPDEETMEEFREEARERALEPLVERERDLENDLEYCAAQELKTNRQAGALSEQLLGLKTHIAHSEGELAEVKSSIAELDPDVPTEEEEDQSDVPTAETEVREDETLRLLVAQHLQGCLGAYGGHPLDDNRFSVALIEDSTFAVTIHHKKEMTDKENLAFLAVEDHLAVEIVPEFQPRNGQ